MKIAHNFNAGPCVLPKEAINNAIEALKDFNGTGMSVIEVSHRSKEWGAVMDECRALWKELLHIPDNYHVLFLGGGASLQFLYVAMNLLENKAGYLETGVWAKKALKEAKGIGNAVAIASSADKTYSYIPKGYTIPTDLDYFHITTNNTIYGTEIHEDMDSPVTLVADMSSDIMSRPVDITKYGLRRRPEKRGTCRGGFRDRQGRYFGQSFQIYPYHAGLQDSYRRREHVQHSSGILHLCNDPNPEMAERIRRRRENVQAQPGKGGTAV